MNLNESFLIPKFSTRKKKVRTTLSKELVSTIKKNKFNKRFNDSCGICFNNIDEENFFIGECKHFFCKT